MSMSKFRVALILVLIFTTTFSPVAADLLAAAKNEALRVAFIGLQCENVKKEIQDEISHRISAMFTDEKEIEFVTPRMAVLDLGEEHVQRVLKAQDFQSFMSFARLHNFDYIFSGTLKNTAAADNGVFMQGALRRFETRSGKIEEFKIRRAFEEIGDDLLAFKQKYVHNLGQKQGSWFSLKSALIIAGLVAAVTMLLRATTGGGEGEDQEPGPLDE